MVFGIEVDAMAGGLAAVVSVQHHDPAFHGPTRSRLASPEVTLVVAEAVAPALRRFCTEQPERAAAIVERARQALAGGGGGRLTGTRSSRRATWRCA